MINELREKIEDKKKSIQRLQYDLEYTRGVRDGLISADQKLEQDHQVLNEAINFIDRMVKMWNAGAEIGGGLLAEYKPTGDGGSRSIPLHAMAKGIIERAKGARDDDGT